MFESGCVVLLNGRSTEFSVENRISSGNCGYGLISWETKRRQSIRSNQLEYLQCLGWSDFSTGIHDLRSKLGISSLSLPWILLATASLYGQNQADATTRPTITTDRPAVTASSTVVPSGYLVFENGFTETTNLGQQTYDLPETLVRFGLTSKTELRFTAPDYYDNFYNGTGYGSGLGDLSLGLKQQLALSSAGFDAALIVSLSFPTGANAISSHGYDPQVSLPWSHPLPKKWTAAGMFSLMWPTQGATRNFTGQATFLVDRQIINRWDAFLEYAGTFPEHGGTQQILHLGTAFRITPNQQLDFHWGFGLSSAAVAHFIGFGYSFQLQALHRGQHSGS